MNKKIKFFLFPSFWFLSSAFLFLCGCNNSDSVSSAFRSLFSFSISRVWLEKINFQASSDVNDSSPITVHIVVAYTPQVLAELMLLDASTYFQKLEQFKADNVGSLDIFAWDVIPGQKFEGTIAPTRMDGLGIVAFARYSTPGVHRAAIGEDKEILFQLNQTDFKITPVKKKA